MNKTPDTNSDAAILDSIKKGGRSREEAVMALFKEYKSLIGMGIKRYNLQQEDAIDAFSDAIVGLVDQVAKGNFRGDAKLSSYIFRIFSWKCIDKFKKRKTYSGEIAIPEHFDHTEPTHDPNPLQKLIAKNEHEKLISVINQLNEPCRKLILDVEYYGYSIKEAAERNGYKNTQTVSSKRYQCIKKLRALLSTLPPLT